VGAAVVEPAERDAVVEVGAATAAPRLGVVDVAPGEGTLAAFGGTRVVDDRQGSALRGGVQSALPPEVEHLGGATQDDRQEAGVAGQPTSLARREVHAGVEPARREPVEQALVVDVHQQRQRVAGEATRDPVGAGREMLDELGEPVPQPLRPVAAGPVGDSLVADGLARPVAGQLRRRGQRLQRGAQEVAVQLGDHEPARERAVPVVGQGQPGLDLGALLLRRQHPRFVRVGQLPGDRLEHPPAGSRSADRTITVTWSWLTAPAANASRVAW
jgi:hypothetical protein